MRFCDYGQSVVMDHRWSLPPSVTSVPSLQLARPGHVNTKDALCLCAQNEFIVYECLGGLSPAGIGLVREVHEGSALSRESLQGHLCRLLTGQVHSTTCVAGCGSFLLHLGWIP